MAGRHIRMAALFAVALMMVACSSRRAPVPPEAPVQAPQAEPAPPAAPAPVPPALPPEVPPPALVYPSTPPAAGAPAAFVTRVDQAGWDLTKVQALLPSAEEMYRNRSGEEPGYRQFAYDGGALRLFAAAKSDTVFAIVADAGRPGHEAFRQLKTQPGFLVLQGESYTTIVRTTQAGLPEIPPAQSLAELERRLGPPTYQYHLHGVGSYVYMYVPEGLMFVGSPTQVKPGDKSGSALQEGVGAMVASDAKTFTVGAKSGRTSADGRWWAGKLALGGYWNNWIVVRTPGRAEQRYQASYFIQEFFWLDDHRLVYGEMQIGKEYAIHVIDAAAATHAEIKVQPTGHLSAMGPAGAGKVWYMGDDGIRHEVTIP
ncbi:MAG TPA: hypothetical protein VNT01_03560 [Symbiobacteriaceae bacterium]|nr:hypothetical protein [Symbiobacteriaceae bacterium]